ncbi:MAG: glycosyltransferase family 4 protein, partial [Clostridiales bacterium]|nr:glycosyltransferase family 4 protein [Clostridiales bacterium]
QELAAIFRRSDIFVLPSYYEGLPLVLIEAMASGMIPVSTDLPGVRPWVEENVRNQNVIFVPMPEMADIDTPTEAGRAKFTYDLYDALLKAAADVNAASGKALPDTSGVTWDGVAARITALAK